MSDIYTLLKTFINTRKATNIETKDRKDRIIIHVKLLDYRGRDYKQFEIIDNRNRLKKKRPK